MMAKLPALGLFAPGSDAAFARAAALHTALLASEAYTSECCFSEAPVPTTLKKQDAVPETPPQFAPGPGTVAAQWHVPAGAPSEFKSSGGSYSPVVLVYVITPPHEDGATSIASPVVGETCFDMAEVRAKARCSSPSRRCGRNWRRRATRGCPSPRRLTWRRN